jgi:hypothetical protein
MKWSFLPPHLPSLLKQVHASCLCSLLFFFEHLGRGKCYHIFPNWKWIKTLYLMTIFFFMFFFQILVTHVLTFIYGVFSNKDFTRFTIFSKTWDFVMTCQITMFMQFSWFVLVFKERYFIMVTGLGDDLFCIRFKKISTICWKSYVWIFSTWTKMNTFSFHYDSHKLFLTF